jgi:hypothetical protein
MHRLREFKSKVLHKIFQPKTDELIDSEEHGVMRRFMVCTPHHILEVMKTWH